MLSLLKRYEDLHLKLFIAIAPIVIMLSMFAPKYFWLVIIDLIVQVIAKEYK